MRTAIYARYSSQLQDARSIEDQVRICQERAAREGWQVTEIFTDYAISGAVRDRPGLNALVDHIRNGRADQVMAEALDRLSRHQGDMSWLHDHIIHAGARIFTLSEGEIGELHIGLKGTMAALFRKDLADKIRRGQSGRVAAGRTPGNIVYGYRKLVQLDGRGEPERGLREIDPDQALIIRRIFEDYLAGKSAVAICKALNAEGVPSPSGKQWQVSMINGDRKRGNGLFANEIYIGRLVYNRTTMVRDPETRRRHPRVNPRDQWQITEVPHLRIIDDATWAAVQERASGTKGLPISRNVRPRKLLSGLIRCGECGGNFIIQTKDKWGCANARTRGTCTNHRRMNNAVLERTVLSGLSKELLRPEHVDLAVRKYHEARKRLASEGRAKHNQQIKRLDILDRQVARLIEAVQNGGSEIPQLVEALQTARAEQETIARALADAHAEKAIILHPAIADQYRQLVANFGNLGIEDPERLSRIASKVRPLIDHITLTPTEEPNGLHIDLKGCLDNMMAIATGEPTKQRKTNATVLVVAEERLGHHSPLSRSRLIPIHVEQPLRRRA